MQSWNQKTTTSWKENYDKSRQCVEKQRYYSAYKVRIIKAIVFPVFTYGCESWTVKKAECQRTDAFELWSWRRLLKVPWTARRSNQSNLRKINSEYSLGELMQKMKLQYSGHLMWTADSLEKCIPDAGKDWEYREKSASEDEMAGWHHWCNGHELGQTPGMARDREAWHATVHGVAKSQTWRWLNNNNKNNFFWKVLNVRGSHWLTNQQMV